MLAASHVVTAPRHKFTFEIRNQSSRPSQCHCRVVHHFMLADEQQRRNPHGAQFAIGQNSRQDTQRHLRQSKMLQAEIHQVKYGPSIRVTGGISESKPAHE
jgi:hypothetical protein